MQAYQFPCPDANALAVHLFRYVYSDISVAVYLSELDEVLDLRQFDAEFGGIEALCGAAPLDTARIILIINQPEGLRELRTCDKRNRNLLAAQHVPVEVIQVCEANSIGG